VALGFLEPGREAPNSLADCPSQVGVESGTVQAAQGDQSGWLGVLDQAREKGPEGFRSRPAQASLRVFHGLSQGFEGPGVAHPPQGVRGGLADADVRILQGPAKVGNRLDRAQLFQGFGGGLAHAPGRIP
jgi:hypothetical protein